MKLIGKIVLGIIFLVTAFLVVIFIQAAMTTSAHADTSLCPNGYFIVARAWSLKALPEEIRTRAEELMRVAAKRETMGATRLDAYQTEDSLPRVLGRRLRTEVRDLALITAEIRVRYVNKDSQTGRMSTKDAGVLKMVDGIGTFWFTEDPRGKVIETVWPTNFISPEVSGGIPRWRLFPNEWRGNCGINQPGLVP